MKQDYLLTLVIVKIAVLKVMQGMMANVINVMTDVWRVRKERIVWEDVLKNIMFIIKRV